MNNLVLPSALVQAASRGDVALFLGAGASRGALDLAGEPMPLGHGLRDLLCDEFLTGNCKDRTLDEVASFVENEHGPVQLENYLAKIFSPYEPGSGHRLLPTFRWQAIYTINFDLLIEAAYSNDKNAFQRLFVFSRNEQSIDKTLRDNQDAVGLFKLHGSIDRIHDRETKLVLSQEGYISWDQNRDRLYHRLEDSVSEYPVVFCGTTLADPHIRSLLSRRGTGRPMQYIVSPNLNEHDVALFASRQITAIHATFDEFMAALDLAIPQNERRLLNVVGSVVHSIERHFKRNAPAPAGLISFLTDNVDHVRAAMQTVGVNAEAFFRGESQSWGPIEQNFDFTRSIYETMMLRIIGLQSQASPSVDVVALKGVAGSGKTVLARRAAYDLAVTYGHLVLFAPPRANLRPEPLIELFELTGARAVLVVDQAAEQAVALTKLVSALEAASVPLTLLIADSQSAMSGAIEEMGEAVKFTLELRRMSEDEIDRLLEKLRDHGCLGLLEGREPEDQRNAFKAVADRQLLVALYEATQGKPLEDILLEEYHRIVIPDAQELYLLVCVLNQYNTPVRAGLVRRLLGVNFNEFNSKLLGPLHGTVYAAKDPASGDFAYRARHAQIAHIVFRNVLNTNSKQIAYFLRIIGDMDISYSSDLDAMRHMINYRNLREVAPMLRDRRRILEVAETATNREAFVLQQRALTEMNSADGDLAVAADYLEEAQEKRPWDKSLQHSRATLYAREAEAEVDPILRKALRQDARGALKAGRANSDDPYVAALMAQLAVDELSDLVATSTPSTARDAQMLRLVEDAERAIRGGLSRSPDFESLILQESRLRKVWQGSRDAVSVLERTLKSRPQLEYVAVAYARAMKSSNPPAALDAINKCLTHHPHSRLLNQAAFELMIEQADDCRDELWGPLRKSFTDEDGNVAMHVHALRYFFLRSEREKFDAAKATAENMRLTRAERDRPRFPYNNPSNPQGLYTGTISRLGEAYAFVRIPSMLDSVFVRPNCLDNSDEWDALAEGRTVMLRLFFNVHGAIARDLSLQS